LCRSHTDYKAPEIPKFNPEQYHYYSRDSRRAVPPTTIILNPLFQTAESPDIPQLSPEVQKSLAAESRQLKETAELVKEQVIFDTVAGQTGVPDVMGVKPPTKKYVYRVADSQPDANGYFTITNYT